MTGIGQTGDATAGDADAGWAAATFARQEDFRLRFDWGPNGLRTLAPVCAVIVIVDVLRFTTAVSVAVDRGTAVFPYRWARDDAAAYAESIGAVLAGSREDGRHSLSPADLLHLPAVERLVLPSPNGAALSFAAREHGARHVLAGSLRNASATARIANQLAADGAIGVIAAGERWHGSTGPLRPCVEDLVGAGAVLAAAAGTEGGLSPEAAAAVGAFGPAAADLHGGLANSASGRELIQRGWSDDVTTAAALDASANAALLTGDAYRCFG